MYAIMPTVWCNVFFFFFFQAPTSPVTEPRVQPCTSLVPPTPERNLWEAVDPYVLLDWLSPPGECARDSELENYLSGPCVSLETPLLYWKKNADIFPRLAKLAAVCLSIPASSGSVERLFSTSGALQRARRASLLPSTIENLVLVSESIRRKEKFEQH